MMNLMMARTVREGTARGARFGHAAAGKTGTTQNARDAWFVGYTAHLVTGVWFGNDDGTPMKNVTGGTLPVTAWRQFMETAHSKTATADLPGYTPITVIPKPRPLDLVAGRPPMPVGATPGTSGGSGAFPPPPDATITGATGGPPRPSSDVGASQRGGRKRRHRIPG